MDKRKIFLPEKARGWLWSPFFDKDIQKVMEVRREPGDWNFCDTRDHALGWPLVVYGVLAGLVYSGRQGKFSQDLIQCYQLDAEFSAALLLALTLYYKNPSPNVARRFREEDESYVMSKPGNFFDRNPEWYKNTGWSYVADKIFGRDSKSFGAKFAKIGIKEIHRCEKIYSKWEENFDARSKANLNLESYPLAVLPRQKFKLSFLSPKSLKK